MANTRRVHADQDLAFLRIGKLDFLDRQIVEFADYGRLHAHERIPLSAPDAEPPASGATMANSSERPRWLNQDCPRPAAGGRP